MQLSRRTTVAFLAIFIGAATACAQADTMQPSAAATTAYQQGQSYERLFQDVYLAPGTCGIVLERAQCARDLETIAAMRNADATDARVRAWFATGDISMQVKDWNSVYVPAEAWSRTPVFAWWYTAGAASIAASLPQGSGIDAYVGSIADVLAQHTSAAPDTSGDWSPTGATPYARLTSVQTQLQQIFPVAPYPAPVFAAGAASYAQLGVYVATAQELVDNSFALSRPESRAFVAAVLAKLQSVHEAFADGLTAAPMQAAINAPLLADNAWLDKRGANRSAHRSIPNGPPNRATHSSSEYSSPKSPTTQPSSKTPPPTPTSATSSQRCRHGPASTPKRAQASPPCKTSPTPPKAANGAP